MAPPQRLITPQEQLQLQLQSQEERERSLNLIIDSDGRTIDKRTGELVQIQSRLPTLKANIQAKKRDIDSKIKKDASSQDLFASGIASTILQVIQDRAWITAVIRVRVDDNYMEFLIVASQKEHGGGDGVNVVVCW